MTRRVRKTMILVVTLAALTLTLVPATQALAATGPTCTVAVNYHNHAVPGLTSGSVTCFMGFGAHSPAVGTLQRALNKCYGEGLDVDNDFGGLTKAALRDAQSRSGTTADGVYGPHTRDALRWISNINANDPCSRV